MSEPIRVTATSRSLSLFIPGEPVAKGRPRASIQGGKIHMRTPRATRAYERRIREAVAAELIMSGLRQPHILPVRLTVEATYPYRKSAPTGWTAKAWREARIDKYTVPKHTKPDLDNITKAVLDGVQGGGWIKDDGQVVDLRAKKQWGPTPGVWVHLEIDPPPG